MWYVPIIRIHLNNIYWFCKKKIKVEIKSKTEPTNTNAKLVRRICDRVYIFVLVDVLLQRIYTRREFVNWREKTRNIRERVRSFFVFLCVLCLGSLDDKDGKKEYAFLAWERLRRRRIITIVAGRDFVFRVSLVTMTYYFIFFIFSKTREKSFDIVR